MFRIESVQTPSFSIQIAWVRGILGEIKPSRVSAGVINKPASAYINSRTIREEEAGTGGTYTRPDEVTEGYTGSLKQHNSDAVARR
jgi:hypothetical protein